MDDQRKAQAILEEVLAEDRFARIEARSHLTIEDRQIVREQTRDYVTSILKHTDYVLHALAGEHGWTAIQERVGFLEQTTVAPAAREAPKSRWWTRR